MNVQLTLTLGVLVTFAGCVTSQKREQYYMVVEPGEEPSAAIYRATARLSGWGSKYKLNEGYVAANVVDALSGKAGEPPDLFSTESDSQRRSELFDSLADMRSKELLDIARAGPGGGDISQIERTTRFYGALSAAAALSPNEQISVGQTGSTDAYAYRKLVFYASATVIRLEEFESELDAIERSTSNLAKVIAQAKQASAEKTKAKLDRRRNLRKGVLGNIQTLLSTKNDLKTWTATDVLGVFGPLATGGVP